MNEKNKKRITADDEQQMYMNIEKRLSDKNKSVNITLTSVFFAFIFIFSVLFWGMPDKEISEEENRSLQTLPAITAKSITDGSFAADFANYMADQFPFRNTFIGIKSACEEILLKHENNGVIIGADGYLITRYDNVDEKTLRSNIKYLSDFKKAAGENGVEVHFAFAGRTVDIAVCKLPAVYGSYSSERAWDLLDSATGENSLEYINLKTQLRRAFEDGEYVYYKTDHHWTTLGAFYAYKSIAESAGIESHEREHYTEERVSSSFYGTTWSSCGAKWIKPDSMDFFRWDGDENCITVRDDGEIINGLYKTDALNTKDKYSAFLGGNTARCDILSDGKDEKETVIVAKDSFANSLVPFLAEEYNVILIDLRYYDKSLLDLCKEENVSKIFFIYNFDTLANESGFRILKMGLDK